MPQDDLYAPGYRDVGGPREPADEDPHHDDVDRPSPAEYAEPRELRRELRDANTAADVDPEW